MKYVSEWEWIVICLAIFSCFWSFTIVLTAIIFPFMLKRLFFQLVLMISVCELLGGLGAALGFPADDSPSCAVQAILIETFYKASWIWITILIYQLFSLMKTGSVGLKYWQMHALSWIPSLAMTLIPLSQLSYGRGSLGKNSSLDADWCTFAGDSWQYELWTFFSWQFQLIICFAFLVYFTIQVIQIWKMSSEASQNSSRFISNTVYLYPTCLCVTWGPLLLFSLLAGTGVLPQEEDFVQVTRVVLNCLAVQSGTLLACVFFGRSRDVRRRW